MGEVLAVSKLIVAPGEDLGFRTFEHQCIVKALRDVTFDHGLSSERMSQFRYGPGDLICARRGVAECTRWHSPGELLLFELPDAVFREDSEDPGIVEIRETPYLVDQRISHLTDAIALERSAGFISGRLFLDGVGRALAAALMQARGYTQRPMRAFSRGLSPRELQRLTEYMRVHVAKDMSIAELAGIAGISSKYFASAFRRTTGYPPHQFLIRIRMEKAMHMLRATGIRITEIAFDCGYKSSQQFAKAFRMYSRSTPSAYRAEFRSTAMNVDDLK